MAPPTIVAEFPFQNIDKFFLDITKYFGQFGPGAWRSFSELSGVLLNFLCFLSALFHQENFASSCHWSKKEKSQAMD